MAQIFHPSMNTLARVSIVGAAIIGAAGVGLAYEFHRSPYYTKVRVVREQPVQFSHEHHVRGLGIDCRYCHTSVEVSGSAGIPPTETCMSCHSQVWTEAPMLEPVRASLRNDEPLVWNRVHDVPDFVYFNHSIHVKKGVGCSTCHGRVDRMPLVWKDQPMTMQWCLDCHKDPAKHVRPREEIFNMEWTSKDADGGQLALGQKLVKDYHIETESGRLTHCYTCHR